MERVDDYKAFFPSGKIKTITGAEVEIPILTLKSEFKALKELSAMIKEVPELKQVNFEKISINDILAVLPSVLEKALDRVVNIVAIILQKDKQWVEANMDSDDLVSVLRPFLKRFARKLGAIPPPQNK